MKTLILSIVLIFGLAATNHGKPINDIYSIKEPVAIQDEAYVDDIPFDTWEIAVDAIIEGDEVKLDEEPYVNDIPFDTRAIAGQYLLNKLDKASNEANVNDIPFDTEKVMYEELASRLTEQYRQEENIDDQYGENSFIICNINDGHVSFVTVEAVYPKKTGPGQKKSERNEYPVTSPEKLQTPQVEMNNNMVFHELIVF